MTKNPISTRLSETNGLARRTRRTTWALGLGFIIVFLLRCHPLTANPVDPGEGLKRFEYRQVHMGLQVRIVLFAVDENAAFDAATAAFSEMARLDAVMSDYRTDSELMRLVRRAGEGYVPVSDDLFSVLERALAFSRLTGGAFDVTVSPLARIWRESIRSGTLPSPARIDSARVLVDWESVRLDPVARSVKLERKGMQLDLGAIAKGYATELAMQALVSAGTPRALIEFGGDVRAGAPPPQQDGWRVEIAEADSAHRFIEVSNVAVASSGDTEQYVAIDGVRYSHVVDPRTGYGLTSRAAATVIAASGTDADALSTSLTLLDAEAGRRLLSEHFSNVRAYVRLADERGTFLYSTF